MQAWRSSSTFDARRELGPWLATISRRAAIDLHRREVRRRHERLDDVATDHPAIVSLSPSMARVYDIWQVREALDQLPPGDAELVRWQHLEGLSLPEIADRLGVPLGTVKSRTFRVHRRLAALLGHLRDEEGTERVDPT